MKINHSKCAPCNLQVSHVEPGKVVQMIQSFHNDHKQDDLFIVLKVARSYYPETFNKAGSNYEAKIGLANLRTGALAYPRYSRECRIIDTAEVCF